MGLTGFGLFEVESVEHEIDDSILFLLGFSLADFLAIEITLGFDFLRVKLDEILIGLFGRVPTLQGRSGVRFLALDIRVEARIKILEPERR